MPQRPQIELTREELDRAEIPMNHVLIKMVFQAEGAKSKGGVIVGFLSDDVFAEGDDSHSANLAEVYGIVAKTPKELYFNPDDPKSMDWDCKMELKVGDMVWYSVLEAKNSVQLICEGVLYKSVPYSDVYVCKRTVTWQDVPDIASATQIVCLNGYVLLRPMKMPQISHLDAISDLNIDMTRGIIAFVGNAVKTYKNDVYTHIDDLRAGDEVLFDKKCPLFYLERSKSLATFDGDNQYWVTQRRRIAMIINRK